MLLGFVCLFVVVFGGRGQAWHVSLVVEILKVTVQLQKITIIDDCPTDFKVKERQGGGEREKKRESERGDITESQ